MEQRRNEDNLEQQQQQQQQEQQQPQVNPPEPPAEHCSRCNSFYIKLCYYNNYSLPQPRYFCKTYRRYWTHGGTLRNIPIGSGTQRGKRARTSDASSSLGNDLARTTRSFSTAVRPPLNGGVVISMISNKNGEGYALLLDGTTFEEIAMAKFPYDLSYGLHGCWVPKT